MRCIVGLVLAVILSGRSSILAQPFVKGDWNKFLPVVPIIVCLCFFA
jgi:hypothetical protein